MNPLMIFLYEWKHFARTPFKVVALILFIIAGSYALHNGASLYERQISEIEKINEKVNEDIQTQVDYFEAGEKGPEARPWIDLREPFWAVWYSPVYHFKKPSPALVYNIGQTEQYGFYKRINFYSSPYDADMAEEIANPERLQSGTLDFSFVVLYLMPLLLLIFLYNIKGAEADGGILSLVYAQTGSKNAWLLSRAAFYVALLLGVILGLMLYGGALTGVFGGAGSAFLKVFLLFFLYLMFWGTAFVLIIQRSGSTLGNTLKMVGLWLLFAFFIPAAVHQWVSTQHPANLMTDFIDANRDEKQELYDLPDSVAYAKLDAMFPEIVDSPVAKDSTKRNGAYSDSFPALVNELMKSSIAKIENSNDAKNDLIRLSYWFNPLTFMQNQLNRQTNSDYYDYQTYRHEIQSMIDKQIRQLVLDTWGGVAVDKGIYLEYQELLSQ